MSRERERLRPWLEGRINSGEVPGLRWVDAEKTKFRITWKHAGKPDFNLETDAVLFRMWAEHTGKYKRGEQPDPSTWKTRFRCALHKMPDIEEVRIPHSLDANEPYRVFRFKHKATSSPPKHRNKISIKHNHCSSVTLAGASNPHPMFECNSLTSYAPFLNACHDSKKNPIPMCFNQGDLFPFVTPPLSSNTSSPTTPPDFNISLFEDIENLTPSIPPYPSTPLFFDQSMDHQQQAVPVMNDDFLFKNNDQCTPYEPTLTELQSVPTRGEQYSSYSTGGGEGTFFNNMGHSMVGNTNLMMYPTQNGSNFSSQMGLVKKFHFNPPPIEMVQAEMRMLPTVTNGFGMNKMEFFNEAQPFTSQSMTPVSCNAADALNVLSNHIENLKINMTQAEQIWSCRVYYNDKEVKTFELNTKHSCRISYGSPDKKVYDSSLKKACKIVQLPDCPVSESRVQSLLESFNDGITIEMLQDGPTWVTNNCKSKVFLSRGSESTTKLKHGIRTKIFEDLKSNDKKFMLSLCEERYEINLVKLDFVAVQRLATEQNSVRTD